MQAGFSVEWCHTSEGHVALKKKKEKEISTPAHRAADNLVAGKLGVAANVVGVELVPGQRREGERAVWAARSSLRRGFTSAAFLSEAPRQRRPETYVSSKMRHSLVLVLVT